MQTEFDQLSAVKDYYGKVLQSKADLKTTACCAAESLPAHLRKIAGQLHEEVTSKFYGCGIPIPPSLDGCTVLDLGCGTGRDCFILSKLVGSEGHVIGVDMTDAQLDVAHRHLAQHTKDFGYTQPNIRFVRGFIEDLKSLDIADNSIDVVVSNCVINLSPAKDRVFAEIFRVLKPGGELYFSDVFCDRRLPIAARDDAVLLGECLGGAMYTEDFRRLMAEVGCKDHRTVSSTPISITDVAIQNKIGQAKFYSLTIRAFKLPLEDRCEDYGQVAYYRGGHEESHQGFLLDDHHFFELNRPMLVCSNTADMVQKTRYAKYFEVIGHQETHFGLFDCGPSPADSVNSPAGACC